MKIIKILIVESPTKRDTISSFLETPVFSTCGVFLSTKLSNSVSFIDGKIIENRELNANKAHFINDIVDCINKHNQQYQTLVYLAMDIDEQGNEIAFDIADYLTDHIVNKKDALIFKRINLNSITQAEVIGAINNAPPPVSLERLRQEAKISKLRRIRNAFVGNHYIGVGAFGLGTVSASILKTIKDGSLIIGEMGLVIKTDRGNFKTTIDVTLENFDLWEERKQQLDKCFFSLGSNAIKSENLFDDLSNFDEIITTI